MRFKLVSVASQPVMLCTLLCVIILMPGYIKRKLWKDEDMKAMAQSLDVSSVIQKWSKTTELSKLKECATFVCSMIS